MRVDRRSGLRRALWRHVAVAALGGMLVTAPTAAFAFCDDWRTSDTVAGTAWTVFIVQDWAQTRYRCDHTKANDNCEANPLLGAHPSDNTIDWYIGGALVGGWAIGCLLPHDARLVWFGLWAVVEFEATQEHDRAGDKGIYGVSLPVMRF